MILPIRSIFILLVWLIGCPFCSGAMVFTIVESSLGEGLIASEMPDAEDATLGSNEFEILEVQPAKLEPSLLIFGPSFFGEEITFYSFEDGHVMASFRERDQVSDGESYEIPRSGEVGFESEPFLTLGVSQPYSR